MTTPANTVMGRIRAPRDSERQQRIAIPAPWYDRDPAMLGNSLTPARMTAIIWERNNGFLQSWVDLADEAREKDPHLHSQLSIREQSVVETEFEVLPGKGSNQRAAIKAAAAWEEKLQAWKSRPGDGLDQWIAEMVGGNYYGHSLHEVVWAQLEGETYPELLELIDTRRLSYACAPSEADPWQLRIWDSTSPQTPFSGMYGEPISDYHADKFLVNRVRVRGSQRTREGLFAVIAWYWLFRIWDWRDLMALTEMVGRPPIIGYFSAGGAKADAGTTQFNGARNASTQELAALRKAVVGTSGALRAMLADTTRLEALKYQLPSGDKPLQLAISEAIDGMMSKAINGSTGVSDIKAGARASAEVAERTGNTFWRADCGRVGRLLSWLGGRYVAANPTKFTATCPAPIVKFKTAPPKDTSAAGDRLTKGRGLGLKITKKHAHQELEIPEPPADAKPEDLLPDPPAPPPAPGAVKPDPNAKGVGRTAPNDTPKPKNSNP